MNKSSNFIKERKQLQVQIHDQRAHSLAVLGLIVKTMVMQSKSLEFKTRWKQKW